MKTRWRDGTDDALAAGFLKWRSVPGVTTRPARIAFTVIPESANSRARLAVTLRRAAFAAEYLRHHRERPGRDGAGDLNDAPPAQRLHLRDQARDHAYDRQHVLVVRLSPVLRLRIHPRAAGICTRIVDKDIDAGGATKRFLAHLTCALVRREIAQNHERAATGRDDVVRNAVGAVRVTAVDHDDRALTRERLGDGLADASAASGY